jgi:glycosyltransferase involved in cell wall biosynthesis
MNIRDKQAKMILIGNYPSDKQESMERFAVMLQRCFINAGVETEIWRPVAVFSRWSDSTVYGMGKWLGYLDKWVLFPIIIHLRLLRIANNSNEFKFHICDHSNAPYLQHLPTDQTGVTCHDVLAIRGALGYKDAYCEASGFGKLLQRWILNNLKNAKILACVSGLTLSQLKELSVSTTEVRQNWVVIHNSFNAEYYKADKLQIDRVFKKGGLNAETPFILHVGSGLPRKNRRMLLDMVSALGEKWSGNICFAGERIDETLYAHAVSLGIAEKLISVVQPSHEMLVALYSACEAFVFPSFSEGFGWPLIEAQACGAPVIASYIEPMPEVSGGAALHADPTDAVAFADAFLALNDKVFRAELIERGLKNSQRFSSDLMVDAYLKLHRLNFAKRGAYVS